MDQQAPTSLKLKGSLVVKVAHKVAIVTGGGGGIGGALAAKLAQYGARVVVADLDAQLAAAVAGEDQRRAVRCSRRCGALTCRTPRRSGG